MDILIIRLVDTGNLNFGRWVSRAISADFDLGAGEVELGVAREASVEGNVLHTDKVLARGEVGWNLERRLILVPGAPVCIFETLLRDVVAQSFLVDLEPVAGTVVLRDITGGLGHIYLQRSWVLHGGALKICQSCVFQSVQGIEMETQI